MASEKKSNQLEQRRGSNRFQTAVFGAYVPTHINSFFDPYAEPAPALHVSKAAMEAVPRVKIPTR